MKRFLPYIFAVLAVIALGTAGFLLNSAEPEEPVPPSDDTTEQPEPAGTVEGSLDIVFSKEGFFYDDNIEIELSTGSSSAEIYYTTNGSVPTRGSLKYEKPISVIALRGVTAIVVKAVAYNGEEPGAVATHTYFVGDGISERFSTIVFSLSADPYDLEDYDHGILVPGRLRDEYIAENPGAKIDPPAPANYNIKGRESERPVFVEVFEQDGTRVVAQNAGMRVHGGWSRAEDQKSLRLIARDEYEPEMKGGGQFHYTFFPGHTTLDGTNSPIDAYNSIVLRNGANDRNFAMIRDEVAQTLASELGFPETSAFAPAAVFLNGEYYGFAWAKENIDEKALQNRYGAPDKNFQIVNKKEDTTEDGLDGNKDLERINELSLSDLTDEDNYNELCSLVDMENLLLYYAVELYMGNDDWPHNNLERWRYYPAEGSALTAPLDGRWRYTMYDLDWTFGLYGQPFNWPSFKNVLETEKNERYSELLTALLKREDCAARFREIIGEIESHITPGHISELIDEIYGAARSEIAYALNKGKYGEWVNEYTIMENHESMIDFAMNRPKYVDNFLNKYFSLT